MVNTSYILNQFLISLFMVLSIAFYTLMERKILSYSQNRKGPNKVSYSGILQPINDAMKLLTKKEFKLSFSNNFIYWVSPFYSFFMLILMLNLLPLKMNLNEIKMSWLIFFCFIAILSLSTILMGWASNSKYTMVGSLRSLSQSISYEIILILSVFSPLYMMNSFDMMMMHKEKLMFIFIIFFFAMIFLLSLICETNRAPFDLAEGESELVSGFNTEYGMTKFSLIFLTEYGMMILMSIFFLCLLSNMMLMGWLLKTMFIMIIFIWLRSSYPRMRYDLLMMFTWKNLLSFLLLISFFLILIL